MRARTPLLALGLVLGAFAPTQAAEPDTCTGFAWPLDTELKWMGASETMAAQSGAGLPSAPDKAIVLTLKPAKSVTMPVAAGVKSQAIGADTFSGWLTLADMKTGLYQISVSHNAWIDVAQGGAIIHSKAFTGARECKVLHKSVRFEIGSGPVTVELSGASAETVKLTIRAAK